MVVLPAASKPTWRSKEREGAALTACAVLALLLVYGLVTNHQYPHLLLGHKPGQNSGDGEPHDGERWGFPGVILNLVSHRNNARTS